LQKEMKELDKKGRKVLPGETAFHLYDTYGFPIDMTADILRDVEMEYDREGFEEAFAAHREKARGSWKGTAESDITRLSKQWVSKKCSSEFLGYKELTSQGKVLFLVSNGKEVKSAKVGEEVELVSNRTPFYGESGGQVGDIGGISGEGFSLDVVDTKKPVPEIVVHKCKVTDGEVHVGESAIFSVDAKARLATAKNHTATHMLHAALKEVLGPHISQSGSLVAPERLRFDFTHAKALSPEEISSLEQKMNERIWLDSPVKKDLFPLDQALATGAVALFDEKYGSQVRVISLGDYSKELCGGTHLDRTGEIGLFKVVKESSVAAGIRRLEAYTGYRALRYIQDLDLKLKKMGIFLGASAEETPERLEQLVSRVRELEKEVKRKRSGSSELEEVGLGSVFSEIKGVKVAISEVGVSDHRELRELADRYLEKIQTGVVALGTKGDGKAFVVVKISKDLTSRFKAGELITPAAKILGGSGGGRAEMAQAGGTEVSRLAEALQSIRLSLGK